ncbi:MAG: NAD-dependent epimerase/dehydratase family protein, partial [Bacteroidota bacterium]
MKLIVTGGAGFIGSHVCDALLAQGHTVHVIDNLNGGKRENLPDGVVFHNMDIRSDEVAVLFEKEKYDAMYHLAAQMDVRKSVADPGFDADVNVLGFLNLMEAGRRTGLKKVVFSSTGGAIYGEPEYVPQDEDHPQQPLSPYGITKLVSEKYLFFYKDQFDIDYVALRYANVYGPRQNPHGDAGVVAIFTQRMLRGQDAFINGDGQQTRDYVFVADVVRANMAALELDGSGIFNVGTGIETNVVELFRMIKEFTGSDIEETHAPGKPGEQKRSVISYARTEKALGWTPQTPIRAGLKETVEWF